jgi:DNA-binding MarR family transcriptional regulator
MRDIRPSLSMPPQASAERRAARVAAARGAPAAPSARPLAVRRRVSTARDPGAMAKRQGDLARVTAAPEAGPATPFVRTYLGYLLGQANHALYKDFEARVRAAGLSFIEWRVLATLHDSPPLPVSRLAHEVLSKQPTVTKLVQRMSEQGLLALQADAADQRRTLVAATARGRRLVRPLVDEARAHESRLLGALSGSETAALKSLLARVAGHAAP